MHPYSSLLRLLTVVVLVLLVVLLIVLLVRSHVNNWLLLRLYSLAWLVSLTSLTLAASGCSVAACACCTCAVWALICLIVIVACLLNRLACRRVVLLAVVVIRIGSLVVILCKVVLSCHAQGCSLLGIVLLVIRVVVPICLLLHFRVLLLLRLSLSLWPRLVPISVWVPVLLSWCLLLLLLRVLEYSRLLVLLLLVLVRLLLLLLLTAVVPIIADE